MFLCFSGVASHNAGLGVISELANRIVLLVEYGFDSWTIGIGNTVHYSS